MTDTQTAALVHIKESGADKHIAAKMCEQYKLHGPMTDFEMRGHMPHNTTTCLLARRRELTQEGIVGTMENVRINPDSSEECMVWGLVYEHDAVPYYPPDTISFRLRGERHTMKIDLMYLSDADLAFIATSLLNELRAKVRDIQEERLDGYARRQSQETPEQATV